jgi:hypothetical protein
VVQSKHNIKENKSGIKFFWSNSNTFPNLIVWSEKHIGQWRNLMCRLQQNVCFSQFEQSSQGFRNCLIPKRSKTSFQRKWAVFFQLEDFQQYL